MKGPFGRLDLHFVTSDLDPLPRRRDPQPARPLGRRIVGPDGREHQVNWPWQVPVAREFSMGVDVASVKDFAAISVIERLHGSFGVVHLERMKIPYDKLIDRVIELVNSPLLRGACSIAVDGTGIGPAVTEPLFKRLPNLWISSVVITSGEKSGYPARRTRTSKVDLITRLVVAMQRGELKVAEALPLRSVLEQELSDFESKLLQSGAQSFSAPAGQHDDLIMSTCLALWLLQKTASRLITPAPSTDLPAP